MASNRRSFLARLAAAGTVLTAAPERIAALTVTRRTRACDEKGLPLSIDGPLPLEFWHDLRK